MAKSWPPLVPKAPRRDSLSSPGEIFLATKTAAVLDQRFSTTGVWQSMMAGSSLWRTPETTGSKFSTRTEPSSGPLVAGGRVTGSSRWQKFCFLKQFFLENISDMISVYLQCWISGTGRHCGEQQREHFSCGQRKPSDTDLLMKAPSNLYYVSIYLTNIIKSFL